MSAVTKFHSRYKSDTADLAIKDWDAFIQESAPDWLQALRRRGHEKISQNGLPTPKLERFHYTNLIAKLKKRDLAFAGSDVVIEGHTAYVKKLMAHIEDGAGWVQEMAEISPAGEDKYGDMMLWDMANAYFRDGLTVDIPANSSGEEPLIVTITGHDGSLFVPRTFFRAGENSDFTIIEIHQGQGSYWNNRVTQIKVEENARLRHYRIQTNSDEAIYTQNTHVEIAKGGQYEAFVLSAGAALSRNQIHLELQNNNARCDLNGVNLIKDQQLGDTTITVEHQAPDCQSNQFYRSVLRDQAHGVFQGKVHVHQIAQQTDGYQLSNALLLSPQAQMDTKPELEIYADDVKCSHGATTGQLEETPLFYLQSRGIPEAQARALLIESFIGEVLEKITHEEFRGDIQGRVQAWLEVHDECAG